MGNCAGICNVKLIKSDGDVTVEKTQLTNLKEKYTLYSTNPRYTKIIYLQKRIKKFLHRKKPELYKNNNTNRIIYNDQLATECNNKTENPPKKK